MTSRLTTWLRFAGHLCRLGLALVFLYAGVLKALDPERLAREVSHYGMLPEGFVRPFAYLLIPVEVAAGAALLINFRPVWSFSVASALMLMFIGAIGFAIATDQPLTDCGCFGSNVPRTPQQALTEDLGMLAMAITGLVLLRKPAGARGGGHWKTPTLVATALASGAFVIASPSLPIDDVATALSPGVRWDSLHVALAESDLTRDAHLVAMLALREPGTAQALSALNKLAASGRVSMIGLYADDDAAYNEFFWTQGPAFPLYHVTSGDMDRLHRRLPRFFAVRQGVVTATWESVPSEEQISRALETR